MKRLISLSALCVALAVGVAACDEDGGPGAPPSGGGTVTYTFAAGLSAANEVPPISNAEAGATGTMTITITATLDAAGAIIGANVGFNGTVTGFPAGSAITIAHLHPGATGTTGGILVNTGLVAGEVTLNGGAGSIVKNNIAIGADVAGQIINNPAGFYFNVHSQLNPPGAVRGQLVRTN
jgi:hypothetical protein